MKKKVLSMLLATTMLATLFTGCGSSEQPAASSEAAAPAASSEAPAASSEAAAPAAEPVTLKWAIWDEATTAYWGDLKNAYEASHPGVTIEMVDLGSTDYMTVLATELSGSGSDFEVVTIKDVPGYATLVQKDVIIPLDDYIAKDGVDSDIVEVETKGSIITTLHYIKSQSRVILDINPWSIPYLLYYGPKVGGTKYYKEIAIGLPGKYSKRVYKMIMDWLTLGDYHEESIAAFRYCLQIPESYDNNKIKTEILDRAKKEIDESGSHIKFDYEFITRKSSTSKTKRAYDTIAFTIKGHSIRKNSRQTNAEIMLMMLVDIADKNRKALCQECVQKIVSDSKFNHIMSKFSYYRKQVQDRKLSKEAYKSTMLKIILEETGFELRSAEHVKNSDRFKRKHNLSGKNRIKGLKD